MKRKIFWYMCQVALFSMVLATALTSWLLCRDMQTQMKQAVITEVNYLESAMEVSGEDFLKHLASRGDGNSVNRITWVDSDGSVLYDSYADNQSLENHGNRPEIEQAFRRGRGESTRLSSTLAEQTYYYACRLNDGTVIRVASTMRSGLAAAFHTIPWMVVMAAMILVLAMLLSDFQTKRIVEPINRLNPDAPQEEKIYDELSPLVRRLEKQKETIRQQMVTLREKQEEFTAITENMREGFIVVDSRSDVISYNSSAIRILGVDLEPSGSGNYSILQFNRSAGFREVVDAALHGQRGEQTLDLNGRYYQIIANPVAESQQKWGVVVVILDVTEQHQREELRREFTANVSHELKTPLTSISGYAEIMKNGLVKPQDMRRFSEKIYAEAQRLITLVGDIIRLSQLDEGDSGIERVPVDLYQVISGVADRMKDVAGKNQISIALKGTSATVYGVPQILDEMVSNLCDNAIKYNKPGGYVIMAARIEDGHPVVTVEDNGIGIPKEEQERIFERFYRVDKSHSRQIGGTGLGLSIVKHGAAFHKAQVEMSSILGKGTKVKIIF
ncbi:MAG: ATP-binding protein [Lachnospiraceae bacterium]|nr:ATP-binding protein [Lachnospiraceae bacterium]